MSGISVIMACTVEELDELDRVLGVESVWLTHITQHPVRDPDTAYRVLLSDRSAMESIVGLLNVKRGILFVEGKAEFIGFNRDWMTKALRWQGKRKEKPKPVPIQATEWEKDDPWESLGYSR